MDRNSASSSRHGRYYLAGLHMDAFGAFCNRSIGPFSPGLNLIFGPNESGKTTMAKFIEGVLFGWEGARGGKNAYRPAGASQAGSLAFAPIDGEGGLVRCSRARNSSGMIQDAPASLLDGVDVESYRNVFLLDGDSLRGMKDAEGICDRLLTAGSGAAHSPAAVAVQVERHLKDCFSKSAAKPDSIANISEELARTERLLKAARARNAQVMGFDRELRELEAGMPGLSRQIEASNERIESLRGALDALAVLDTQERQLACGAEAHRSALLQDAFEDEESEADRGPRDGGEVTDRAFRGLKGACAPSRFDRRLATGLALGGFAAFALLGVALLAMACATSSLGVAVASAACFFAAACLCMALVLAGQRAGLRRQAAAPASPRHGGRPREGLRSGEGDATACSPLDAARQREAIAAWRERLAREVGGGHVATSAELALLLEGEMERRSALQGRLLEQSARAGELRRILEEARGDEGLDELLAQQAQLRCRLDEAVEDYAVLLVAQQAMDDALRAWELSSQPLVFAQAGRLMSLMTEGRWCGIAIEAQGGLSLVDAAGSRLAVRQLSLGTCQQMHLALKAALLMVCSEAGASLPVIADEVLACFDDSRRESAALVLAELARSRQVLAFTCHREVAELIGRVSPDVNIVRL